ncbi:glycerophosphoryl diester phosphodiesterase membrane domain-containing protein [Herbiconiux sp. P15]|uniref:glycerophosphoryl diester phosphodiesterase membrane domain-containing protein n=1 Tax=Herbiconiux liukaitaii TaxID=3342799 RepID=UPI0035BA53B2
MSENDTWAAPGADKGEPKKAPEQQAEQLAQATPPAPPQYGEYAPPSAAPAQPQYGQYAPPPAPQAQQQYGQYPPPPPYPQQQPAQPQYQQPYGQPQYQQPQYGEPQYQQPQYQQPGYAQQPYGQPQYAPQDGTPAWAQQGYAQPTATGWAPPPKPGLIPLRPLGFGTLLGAPFQVVRRNPKATFGSGLIVQLLIVLVTVLFVGAAAVWAGARTVSAVGSDLDAIEAGNVAIIVVSLLVPLGLSLFASALLQAVLVLEVSRATLGEKRRLGELWKAAFRRILPLTGWFALIALAVVIVIGIVVGLIVLATVLGETGIVLAVVGTVLVGLAALVLGVWLGTKLALVPSVIVLEKLGVFAAMRRSWALTRGNFWRTFGVIALVSVILNFATQILSTPFSFLIPIVATLIDPNNSGSGIVAIIVLYFVFLAFTIILSALTSVVQAATVAVVYLDLRMRQEGLDIELTRFVESRQDGDESWPDPYLPRRKV